MPSRHLTNIELIEVCRADPREQRSIPPNLFERVVDSCLGLMMELYDESKPPETMAAELGEIIDSTMDEVVAQVSGSEAAQAAHLAGQIYQAYLRAGQVADVELLEVLRIYQLDRLIAEHENGWSSWGLSLIDDLLAIENDLAAAGMASVMHVDQEMQLSEAQRLRAKKRHSKAAEARARWIAEWERDAHSYESRADFVQVNHRTHKLKYRTAYHWLSEHDKSKRESEAD